MVTEEVSATVDGFAVEESDIERFHDTSIRISYTFPKVEKYAEFTDVDSSKYYYEAVNWAYENGITSGVSATAFGPEQTCTRGQVVTFLHRYENTPAPSSYSNPFTDVINGEYYYNAVLWAVGKGITNGLDATTFGPNQTCTRGQIVTFLYRDMK